MTLAMACAAAFMLGPFLLIFFSLGDFGLIVDSARMTKALNPSPIVSFSLANSFNLWTFGFSAFGSTEQTSSVLDCHFPLACACYSSEKY